MSIFDNRLKAIHDVIRILRHMDCPESIIAEIEDHYHVPTVTLALKELLKATRLRVHAGEDIIVQKRNSAGRFTKK